MDSPLLPALFDCGRHLSATSTFNIDWFVASQHCMMSESFQLLCFTRIKRIVLWKQSKICFVFITQIFICKTIFEREIFKMSVRYLSTSGLDTVMMCDNSRLYTKRKTTHAGFSNQTEYWYCRSRWDPFTFNILHRIFVMSRRITVLFKRSN